MRTLFSLILIVSQALQGITQPDTSPQLQPAKTLKPLIVGHRGGFDNALPENSIALFDNLSKEACNKPVSFEFDIRESASGTLYIMHDSTVDRTTSGAGKINELSDTYLNSLFLLDRKGTLTSEKIPHFEEVLNHFKDKNVVLMLDVKGKIVQKVIQTVKQYKMESKCIVLTFNTENTLLVKNLSESIRISV